METKDMAVIRRQMRGTAGWAIVCLLLALPFPSCKEKPHQAPPPPAVTVAHPIERRVTDRLELTGNTQAVRTVQLRARVAGYLEKVLFQDGQFVKKDQLLFLLQQNTYQDALKQAEAAISLQKAQLECPRPNSRAILSCSAGRRRPNQMWTTGATRGIPHTPTWRSAQAATWQCLTLATRK